MYQYRFMAILMVLICSTALGSERLTIDGFEYTQESSAQEAWKPQDEGLPVELVYHSTDRGEKALILPCDFSIKEKRCYWDSEVALDLTKFGKFAIWVYARYPGAVTSGNLYFESNGGWFSGRLPVEREGWQRLYLWKSDFQTEGSPLGWDSISKIRLSFWKADSTNTIVAVDDLEAVADEIMIVFGDLTRRSDPSASRSVQSFCSSMAEMLEELDLQFGVVNDTDVESGALSGCKLAIFPYNSHISDRESEEVRRFVQAGGRIMLFYSLPEQLARLLGTERAGWTREEYPGQFSSIALDAKAVEGLPGTIAQGSWNVTIPKPIGSETEIIGEWVDTDGKGTKIPAVTLHPNGVFMGHVLLPNDSLNKRQMLLALFGKLLPNMRRSFSEAALQSVGRMAGFANIGEVSRFVEDNVGAVPEARRTAALEQLAGAKTLLASAERASEDDRYGEMLNTARKAVEELRGAFFQSLPSREKEFRALWCHSAFGIPGWDWDRSIKLVKESGFSAIIPNMLWAGLAYYPSDVLPVAQEFEKGDQIELCLKACRKYGVQIHVWKVNWNLSRSPAEFVERMREEGRLQKDRRGNDVKWLCPSHPSNFKLELDSMLEIVRKYDVDGIHFDYIRYPNENACYCSNCKEAFEKSRGIQLSNWPEEVLSGKHSDDFLQWRAHQITRLVKAVSQQAREINPKVKVSAAVFRDYPRCRRTVGQDWKLWVESGYLDFICPMDYTADNHHLRNLVINQLAVVKGRVPVYPGIGASAPGLPPEQVAMQIYIARDLGVSGFTIFNYDLTLARDVLPALSRGLTSSP